MKMNFERNYIVITGWMLNDLTDLKGNELLLYALIYGLGGSDNIATLSIGQISKMLHVTRKQVTRIINKLENDGYITKNNSTIEGCKNEKNSYSISSYSSGTKLHYLMGQNDTTLKINKKINKTYTHNKRDIREMSKSEVLELAEEYKVKYNELVKIAKTKWIDE